MISFSSSRLSGRLLVENKIAMDFETSYTMFSHNIINMRQIQHIGISEENLITFPELSVAHIIWAILDHPNYFSKYLGCPRRQTMKIKGFTIDKVSLNVQPKFFFVFRVFSSEGQRGCSRKIPECFCK